MASVEYDVFVCCREPEGAELARTLADGLARLGFLVSFNGRAAHDQSAAARFAAIADAPDFVVVMTASDLETASETDDMRREVAQAVRHGRVIVPVRFPGERMPDAAALPPDVAPVASRHPVIWDPARPAESLALLAHSLSSDAEVEERRLMRRARWAIGLVAAIFLAVVAGFAVPALYRVAARPPAKPALPPFAIAWAGVGQRAADGRQTVFDVSDGIGVAPGDRIKLVFVPNAAGHAYVLASHPGGGVTVLFPDAAVRGASAVRAGVAYTAPPGPAWFDVGSPDGPDVIHVMAGYDPLENLEEIAEEADTADSAGERADLLASTLAGLIDGRSGAFARQPRTRGGNRIDARLPVFAAPLSGSVTLDNGPTVERRLSVERGLISAVTEIRLRPAAPR